MEAGISVSGKQPNNLEISLNEAPGFKYSWTESNWDQHLSIALHHGLYLEGGKVYIKVMTGSQK